MTRFNRIAAALLATGALSFAAPALANDYYPRIVGSGQNASVEYAPGNDQNIVGGGAVIVRDDAANEVQIRHLEPRFAQAPRQGVLPVTVGSGENAEIVWVPADTAAEAALAGRFGPIGG